MLATEILSDMLEDCRDAARINAVVNDVAVRPFVGLPEAGDIDLTEVINNPANLFPFGEHGGFALIWTAPHCYEVHTFVLPSGRGLWARWAAACGIDMARERGARMLWTRVPRFDLPHVRSFARGMGMAPTGESAPLAGTDYDVLAMDVVPCL